MYIHKGYHGDPVTDAPVGNLAGQRMVISRIEQPSPFTRPQPPPLKKQSISWLQLVQGAPNQVHQVPEAPPPPPVYFFAAMCTQFALSIHRSFPSSPFV